MSPSKMQALSDDMASLQKLWPGGSAPPRMSFLQPGRPVRHQSKRLSAVSTLDRQEALAIACDIVEVTLGTATAGACQRAGLEQCLWRFVFEAVGGRLDADRHHLSLRRSVVQFLSVATPPWLAAAVSGYHELGGTGETAHVHFVTAGLFGAVSHPSTIRRELRL